MEQRTIPEVWTEKFNVNIKFIDEQHQYFFKILKELEAITTSKTGLCHESISAIFFSLVHYVDHYLIQEEISFKEFSYPGLKDHHIKHNFFVSGIINLKDDFASGKTDVCERLLSFMTNYFYDHILEYDMSAVEYLKNSGFSN